MRIFYAFLILLVSAFLFMLPVSEAIDDYRQMQRTDTNTVDTAVAVTTGNVTLFSAIYNDDTSAITITSGLSTDVPLFSSYNTTTRLLAFSGLTANATRVITVVYFIDALSASAAVNTFLGWLPYIWLLVVVAFIPAALFAIFTNRA